MKSMIIIKFKELLASKERQRGKKIPLEEISTEVGVSTATLSRLGSPSGYVTNTNLLDRICAYFDCQIADLIEYIPDKKSTEKKLSPKDYTARRRFIEEQLPGIIESKISSLGITLNDVDKIPEHVDLIATDEEGRKIFILVKPTLYHTFSKKAIENALYYNPHKLFVFTCSNKLPFDLIDWKVNLVNYYQTEIIYDDVNNKILDVTFDTLSQRSE